MNQKRVREALLRVALQPRNIAQWINRGMAGVASQGLTVMALDGQWLKLLHAAGTAQNRKITMLAACPVQGASTAEIQERLREACAPDGIGPAEVLVVNPTHLCTVRLFSLPSTDPKEIRDIVDLQAEKHTPYAKEEILTDFKIIDQERTGYSRILLIITHQDVVHRSVRLAEAAGWTVERVGCELEGLVSWVRRVKKDTGTNAPAGTSLIVDVDANNTVLLVMQGGQPQFQRSLATGIEQLEGDPPHAGERLMGELERSIEALEGEDPSTKIQDILFTGAVDRLGEFKAQVERGLGVPVTLVSPWQGCELSGGARAALERLPEMSFASLVGLTFEPGVIDLTPQATKLRLAFETKAKTLVLLGCQCIGALILVSLLFIGRSQKEERYYAKLRTLYEDTVPQALRVEETLKQLQFVEERLQQQGQLLSAVSALAQLSPAEVRWNALTFTQGETIILSGTAEQLPKIYEFSAGIASSPQFGEVEARRVAKRRAGEQDVTDFELRCPLVTARAVPGAS